MLGKIMIMLLIEVLLVGGVLLLVVLGIALNRTHERNRRYSESTPGVPLAPVVHLARRGPSDSTPDSQRSWVQRRVRIRHFSA